MDDKKEPMKLHVLSMVLVSSLLSSIALTVPPAIAEKSLKKKVFEDCPGALEGIESLTPGEQREFIDYLTLVLKIPSRFTGGELGDIRTSLSQPGGVTGNPGISPGMPVGGPPQGLLGWHTSRMLDPERETKAKECAVKLLAHLTPASFAAVADMLEALGDPFLPNDLQDSITAAAWGITVKAAREESFVPSRDVLGALLSIPSGDPALFAENTLVEHHRTSKPFLIEELRKPGNERRDRILRVLHRIDAGDGEVARDLLPLLNSADDTLRVKVIESLALFEHLPAEVLGELVALLHTSSDPVRNAARRILQEYARDRKLVRIGEVSLEIVEAFLLALPDLPPEVLPLLEHLVSRLIEKSANLAARLEQLMTSQDPKIRGRALGVYVALGLKSDSAFSLLLDALYDQAPHVRLKAIHALGQQHERADQVITAFQRLLKNVAVEADPRLEEEIVLEVARVLPGMPPGRSWKTLIPYFIDALAYRVVPTNGLQDGEEGPGEEPVRTPVTAALITIGNESRSLVIKALRNPDPVVRVRAVHVLGSLHPLEARDIREIVAMLGDRSTNVVEQAERVLVDIGRRGVPELEKMLRSHDAAKRSGAARVLVALGAADERAEGLFLKGLSELSCLRRSGLAEFAPSMEPRFRALLMERLAECLRELGAVREKVIAALSKLGPLSPSAGRMVIDFLGDSLAQPRTILHVLERVELPETESSRAEEFLLKLLDARDNMLTLQALRLLCARGQLAEPTLLRIERLADDTTADWIVRDRAAAVLLKHQPRDGKSSAFLLNELRGERWQWALSAIALLPPDIALWFLTEALRQLPEEQRYVAAEGLASIDLKGARGSPELLSLLLGGLESTNRELRFQSLMALIRVDPTNRAVGASVRRELEGEYSDRLAVGSTYEALTELFEAIIANPDSFVQLQAARRAKRLAQKG